MKGFKSTALQISILLVMLLLPTFVINAQVPIENLLAKYEQSDRLQVFNLSKEKLNVAKQVSLNLGTDQKNLIRQTDEQYTLVYTGSNPPLSTIYDEAIGILESKNYRVTTTVNEPNVSSITYALSEEDKIKEIVTIVKSSNTVSILVSIGCFDKAGYEGLKKSESTDKK